MKLELNVEMKPLWTIPCLHFPPSRDSTFSPCLSSALIVLMWQWNQDLDVVEREEARLAVQHALVPVLVNLIGQGDDVALVETQLSLVLWLKVV